MEEPQAEGNRGRNGWLISTVNSCASKLFECGTQQGEVSRDGESKHDAKTAKTCGPRLPLVSIEVHRRGDAWCPLSYGNAMPALSNFWLWGNWCYVYQVLTWGNNYTCFLWNPFSDEDKWLRATGRWHMRWRSVRLKSTYSNNMVSGGPSPNSLRLGIAGWIVVGPPSKSLKGEQYGAVHWINKYTIRIHM